MKGLILFSMLLIAIPVAFALDIYEPDDSYQNSTYLETNWTKQTHSFDYAGDKDYINFTAIAGSRYIIETFNKSDIDLTDTFVYLYSTDGTTLLTSNDDIINGELRNSRISWTAPSNGTFFLKVIEYYSNVGGIYGISIVRLGKLEPFLVEPINNSQKQLGSIFNFTAGVKCYDGYCLNISAYLDPEETKTSYGKVDDEVLESIEKDGFADVIITISDNKNMNVNNAQLNLLSTVNKKDFKIKYKYNTFAMISGRVNEEGLNKLKNNPEVSSIEFDKQFQISLDSAIPLVKANNVWPIIINNSNLTGIDESICIIDTGIDYTHSAFGSCASTSNINDGSCPKVIGGHDFVNNDNDPYDDNGHGTHVAGIVASEDSTYSGVAPGAKIISIKSISSSGSGSDSDVLAGIDWCINNASKFNISAISMSLGENGFGVNEHCNYMSEFAAAINLATLNNIMVVSAAGNDGYTDGITAPACVENATSVGAVDDSDNPTYNRGFILDIFAPGTSVRSPYLGGGYRTFSGTSMATPFVAGAATIIRQVFRLLHERILSPFEIKHILRYNGKFIYDAPSSTVIPRLDLEKAASAKGLIPTTIGARPFYTLSSNPHNESCLEFISDGSTCNQTWIVNTTGEINSTWEFFLIYEGKYNFNLTQRINITIISPVEPQITIDNTINQSPVIELGSSQQILANISNATYVNISINNSNFTMNQFYGLYNYSFVPLENGTINYTIYYSDNESINQIISGFFVNDTTDGPLIYEIIELNDTTSFNQEINILATILDGLELTEVLFDYNGTNFTMNQNSRASFNYQFTPTNCGNNKYKLFAKNIINYSAYANGTVTTIDCCGNNACESSESCSSCSNDCGECPVSPPDSGGGGGGGGSSGGGGTSIARDIIANNTKLAEKNISIPVINNSKNIKKPENKSQTSNQPEITGASVQNIENVWKTKAKNPTIIIPSLAGLILLVLITKRLRKKH